MKISRTCLIPLLLMPSIIYAAFEYRSGTPPMSLEKTTHQCTLPGVVQLGQGTATRTLSFGHAIPVIAAARMITPDGWRITADTSLASLHVTWPADRLWTNTLSAVLTDINACAIVDWHQQTIALYRAGKIKPVLADLSAKDTIHAKSHLAVENEPTPQTDNSSASPTPTTPSSTEQIEPAKTLWHATSGQTVRQTLNAWAKAAHWQRPIWDLDDDALITANASFTGTFEDAVAALIHNVALGGTPIAVKLYQENKVIHVIGGS